MVCFKAQSCQVQGVYQWRTEGRLRVSEYQPTNFAAVELRLLGYLSEAAKAILWSLGTGLNSLIQQQQDPGEVINLQDGSAIWNTEQ